MRQIQLYLEDELWNALRLRARNEGRTIPELIRVAVRERYFGTPDARKIAMQRLVGGQEGLRASTPSWGEEPNDRIAWEIPFESTFTFRVWMESPTDGPRSASTTQKSWIDCLQEPKSMSVQTDTTIMAIRAVPMTHG